MNNNENLLEDLKLDEAAIQLLKDLEKENSKVREFLIKSYKGLPVSPEMKKEAYDYFISHSVIITAMAANRGSSVITEFLYDRFNSFSSIDKYVLSCKTGKAVKSRLIAIEEKLPSIIKEYSRKGSVLIGNLGSGPGRDIIDVLYNCRNIPNVKAVHIDKDDVALERGKIMAKSKDVDHLIEFAQANLLKYETSNKFDILLLIGILCPLDAETCINILKTIKKLLKKDGCLIASNATKKMQQEDPFAGFIMDWTADWNFVFKDEEELKQIFEKAGYAWKTGFRDSYGFHLMGVGTPID
jgi:SAM-dependent methyltransferase